MAGYDDDNKYSLMEALAQVASTLQQLIPIDNMIGVTDRDKFIAYAPGKDVAIPGNIIGMEVPSQDAVYMAISSGRRVILEVPEEAFGVSFKSVGMPVKDRRGNIVGGIGIGMNNATEKELIINAESASYSAQEISKTTEDLASSATLLAQVVEELNMIQGQVMEQVTKTDEILNFINEVAATSKMLGLNAAIEAARAGDAGRGFAVVAEEIRKMAENSSQSVKQIREILNRIRDSVLSMEKKVNDSSEVSQRQAAASQEIASTVQQFASSLDKIDRIAKNIFIKD